MIWKKVSRESERQATSPNELSSFVLIFAKFSFILYYTVVRAVITYIQLAAFLISSIYDWFIGLIHVK